MIDGDFKECASCAAKPGSPQLCGACLHNRALVSALQSALRASEKLRELCRKADKARDSLTVLDVVATERCSLELEFRRDVANGNSC